MSGEKITRKDVILMFGGAITGAIAPTVIGLITGSFGVVLSFALEHAFEAFLWTVLVLSLGALTGLLVRGHSAKDELADRDAEIEKLRKARRKHDAQYKEFTELISDEQRFIVNVWLSEPSGLTPSDELKRAMGNWVKMNDFVRHDSANDKLHLVNDVEEMLLENPRHVYDLMAARVTDPQKAIDEAGDAESETPNGMRVLSEEESERLISSLTDSMKGIVAEAYENGGAIQGDYIDAELTNLQALSIMIRPDYAYPGMPCTWTMNLTIFQFLKSHECLLDGFLEGTSDDAAYETPSVDLILQMSPFLASRVYQAYKKGEYIPLSEIERAAIDSIGGKDGLFEYKRFANPLGQILEVEYYGLSKPWIAFLDDPIHLKQLRSIAGTWLKPEE